MNYARKTEKYFVLFGDEMTAQLTPTLIRMWAVKGHQPEPGMWLGTHQKTHVFGAINAVVGRFHSMQAERINGENFIRFLKKLEKIYIGKSIIFIVDNAKWHKAKKVMKYLEERRIRLIFLPSYCPQLNPVEKLWKKLRREVTHNYFYGELSRLKASISNFARSLIKKKEMLLSFCRLVNFQ